MTHWKDFIQYSESIQCQIKQVYFYISWGVNFKKYWRRRKNEEKTTKGSLEHTPKYNGKCKGSTNFRNRQTPTQKYVLIFFYLTYLPVLPTGHIRHFLKYSDFNKGSFAMLAMFCFESKVLPLMIVFVCAKEFPITLVLDKRHRSYNLPTGKTKYMHGFCHTN